MRYDFANILVSIQCSSFLKEQTSSGIEKSSFRWWIIFLRKIKALSSQVQFWMTSESHVYIVFLAIVIPMWFTTVFFWHGFSTFWSSLMPWNSGDYPSTYGCIFLYHWLVILVRGGIEPIHTNLGKPVVTFLRNLENQLIAPLADPPHHSPPLLISPCSPRVMPAAFWLLSGSSTAPAPHPLDCHHCSPRPHGPGPAAPTPYPLACHHCSPWPSWSCSLSVYLPSTS